MKSSDDEEDSLELMLERFVPRETTSISNESSPQQSPRISQVFDLGTNTQKMHTYDFNGTSGLQNPKGNNVEHMDNWAGFTADFKELNLNRSPSGTERWIASSGRMPSYKNRPMQPFNDAVYDNGSDDNSDDVNVDNNNNQDGEQDNNVDLGAVAEDIGQQTRSKDDLNIFLSGNNAYTELTLEDESLSVSQKKHRRTRSDGMHLKKTLAPPIVIDPDIYRNPNSTPANDLFSNVGGTPVMRRKKIKPKQPIPSVSSSRAPSRPTTTPNSRSNSPQLSEKSYMSKVSAQSSSWMGQTSTSTTRQSTPLLSPPSPSVPDYAFSPTPPKNLFGLRRVMVFYLFVFALAMVSVGYDLGITSAAKIRIEEYWGLTPLQTAIVSAFLNLGSAFGALLSGSVCDKFGRRASLLWSGLFQMGGSVLMGLSVNFEMLCAARFVEGLGVGAALMVVPLYVSELSPQSMRGTLVAIMDVSVGVGVVLGYFSGWALFTAPLDLGWRWMLGLGAVPASVLVALVVFVPESPRWLMENGLIEEAEQTLNAVCTAEEAEMAVFMIQREREATKRNSVSMIFCPPKGWRGMLVVGFGIAVLQQGVGIESATYYTPEILRNAGVVDQSEQLIWTMVVGTVKVLFVVIATLLIDKRLGRRPMLLISAIGMTLSQVLLGINYQYSHSARPTIAVAAQLLYVASYSLGFGPVTWVVMSEIFPVQVRGTALGLATFMNRLTNSLVASTYLTLQLNSGLGSSGVSFLYATTSFLALIFVFLTVPETKGKSLEDIEGMMKDLGTCSMFSKSWIKQGYSRITS